MRAVTIKLCFKLEDGETESISQFIKNCTDGLKRESSLHRMQEAYSHLEQNGGLEKLPAAIAIQGKAVHSLLSAQPGGYVLQAFKLVAEILDDVVPYDQLEAKVNRESTIERLRVLLTDGARQSLFNHPYEYSAHLYVVLYQPKRLQALLSSGIDPNIEWKHSRLTPLHVAAQEGKQEMVKILLSFRARKSMKDLHDQLPVDYARAAGHTEIVKLLEGRA